eukprot:12593496-Alexandrium_andersonii.AAC.1
MAAGSWNEECVQRLLEQPEAQSGVGHICRFGMVVPRPASVGGPGHQLARKPTRRMRSSPEILKRVCLRCSNE